MRRLILVLTTTLAACGSEPTRLPVDAGPRADAGAGGRPVDAGLRLDAGEATDSGAPADAGFPDSGVETDAGTTPDAGFADSGVEIDAGATPDAGVMAAADPEVPGPYGIGAVQVSYRNANTGNEYPVDCRFPTSGPSAGPFPVALIGHGFRIGIDQYTGYAAHLASFGYVACIPDFPDPALRPNHVENAQDVLGVLDWLGQANGDAGSPLQGLVDANLVGATGHSLGGKLAFIAADLDPRVDVIFAIDPVDGAMLCDAARCPDATDLLPFSMPIGIIGETLDATGGGQACAPMADNFQTFYAAAGSPALEVDALGASHTSFVDDPSTCGLACLFCQSPSAAQQDVLQMTRAFLAAFFERHLRGDVRYDAYLTGGMAQQRYVATNRAMIRSK